LGVPKLAIMKHRTISPAIFGILALVLASATNTKAQLPQFLSDSSKIVVMTLGPAQSDVYLAFGHSAVRVVDYKLGTDIVFNYGVFNFNQPNFYLNFARGKLLYKLGAAYYKDFKESYIEDNRSIVEQELNLTTEEKQAYYNFLYENYKPENRDYYYNYVYDNCATRIRDGLEKVFPDRISYKYPYETSEMTFRDLMDLYLGQQPWGDLGIDLCLGSGIDHVVTGYEYMFLPDYVEKAFEAATLSRDGAQFPLVREKEYVFVPADTVSAQGSLFTPTLIFTLVFLMVGFSTNQEWKRGIRRKWLDFLVFFVAGAVGLLLLFLWFATDHVSSYNYNLLWAIPLNMVVAFFALSKQEASWAKPYLYFVAAVLVTTIVLWAFIPQKMNLAFIPFMLTILLRAIYWAYTLRKIT